MSVFNSLYAGQYDQLYAEKNYLGECDLIEAAVKRHAGSHPATLVDIGCGTGGHAIELAKRGYKVTGVDLSPSMIEQARQKAALLTSGEQPAWLCGDARDFDTGMTFDLGIMMFAVIGYLTTNEDVLKGLRNIRRQLKTGALFVCDFWYGPSVLSARPADRVRTLPTEGGRVIRASSTTLDVVNHTADVTFKLWTLEGDRLTGETTETHRLRYYFPQEFALLLSQAGFTLQSMSGFPTLDDPLTEQTWNAFVVAKAS
ncbi:class I SAM-dependent DNA methyltransferase [Polaromonas sp.]|uniref:class I SAM-dependent DNA methyltransferase n=1 Tax=Polaromonas sp. TaxID=1869339 RepID=UPI003C8533C4